MPGLLSLATRVRGKSPTLLSVSYREPSRNHSVRPKIVPIGVFGVGRVPVIPHRECPILACAGEILLSNATPTLSIEKSRTPVRGLRPKSRPFIICLELAIPIFSPTVSYRYFIPHPPELSVPFFQLCCLKTILRGIRSLNGRGWK
jgi:hypothetical protein